MTSCRSLILAGGGHCQGLLGLAHSGPALWHTPGSDLWAHSSAKCDKPHPSPRHCLPAFYLLFAFPASFLPSFLPSGDPLTKGREGGREGGARACQFAQSEPTEGQAGDRGQSTRITAAIATPVPAATKTRPVALLREGTAPRAPITNSQSPRYKDQTGADTARILILDPDVTTTTRAQEGLPFSYSAGPGLGHSGCWCWNPFLTTHGRSQGHSSDASVQRATRAGL